MRTAGRMRQSALERIDALVEALTPGQRWTSALIIVLALMVIAFGLPNETVFQQDGSASIERGEPDRPILSTDSEEDVEGRRSPPSRVITAPAPRTPAPERPIADASDARGRENPPGPGPASAAPSLPAALERPDIVALVRTDATAPGRDDASIARAFLDQARFDATVIELTDDDALCQEVADAGEVVIASHGLPSHLRDCLVEAERTIITYDALGGVPAAPGRGAVISTRRGDRASVGDLGRWALSTGALGARPGLVVSTEYRVEVDKAIDDLAALGVGFEEVWYIPAGPAREPTIVEGVEAFARAEVDTVVFAADVDDQARWVDLQGLVGPPVSYLVSDVGDAIVDESYPPWFADATAFTSLRSPWWERDEGETEAQTACRSHWEDNAPPGRGPTPSELVLAFLWCQHAWMIVEPSLDAVDRGAPFHDALHELVVASPLTSELGPLGDGHYGPRHSVLLTWNGDCACWESDERRFAER